MQHLSLLQGTPEWLDARRSRIGGSDAAAILGVSPYKTPLQLWEEKTGRRREQQLNPAMLAGTMAESHIRQWYELQNDVSLKEATLINSKYPWAIASVDGISKDNVIIECKFTNFETFEGAKAGNIASHHYAQLQHYIAVCEVDFIDYVCMYKSDIECFRVHKDESFIEDLMEKERYFYETHMLGDVPPETSEKDYVEIECDAELIDLADKFEKITALKNQIEKEHKIIRERLIDATDDGNSLIGNIRLTKSYSNTVDYRQAAIDSGIDLSKYKKQSVRWTTTIRKKDG